MYHYHFLYDGEYAVRSFLPNDMFLPVITSRGFEISLCESSINQLNSKLLYLLYIKTSVWMINILCMYGHHIQQ